MHIDIKSKDGGYAVFQTQPNPANMTSPEKWAEHCEWVAQNLTRGAGLKGYKMTFEFMDAREFGGGRLVQFTVNDAQYKAELAEVEERARSRVKDVLRWEYND